MNVNIQGLAEQHDTAGCFSCASVADFRKISGSALAFWLISGCKQGAFQALVYLNRYSEGALARLRAEYVAPLTGKLQARIEMLQKDALAASSTAARNKLAKEVEKLKKKHVELLAYDEQLRHYADMRITLDLDDGVKVNYGKFGDLLDSVKVVTGGAGDD